MNQLVFRQLELGQMANFVYLLSFPKTYQAILIDPAWNIQTLLDILQQEKLTLTAVLLTHTHPDHVGGQNFLGIPYIEGLESLLEKLAQPVPIFVHEAEKDSTPAPKELVKTTQEGQRLEIANMHITCLHTPGHTPGSQCFLVDNLLFTGDTLFCGSCGRTDLPGSNPALLQQSLFRLAKLDDEIKVAPGHHYNRDRPTSTIGYERTHNPYMQGKSVP